jgi:hypothetical protein
VRPVPIYPDGEKLDDVNYDDDVLTDLEIRRLKVLRTVVIIMACLLLIGVWVMY